LDARAAVSVASVIWLGVLLAGGTALAADLKPGTVEAFQDYLRANDTHVAAQSPFLWTDQDAARRQRVRGGEIVIEQLAHKPERRVPGGLIHDWMGAVFIPRVTLAQVLELVQDYDRHKNIYRPEVLDSRVLSRDGDHFRIFLRLLKKKVLTVVLDTEHEVEYTPLGAARCRSRSSTTSIREVQDAGKSTERKLAEGAGHGFLWRLDTYWRFEARDGGVYAECQAISLTRDVPTGLGWLIDPIIRNLPRESLANTLRATRDTLTEGMI
jgi:hypothetical protein